MTGWASTEENQMRLDDPLDFDDADSDRRLADIEARLKAGTRQMGYFLVAASLLVMGSLFLVVVDAINERQVVRRFNAGVVVEASHPAERRRLFQPAVIVRTNDGLFVFRRPLKIDVGRVLVLEVRANGALFACDSQRDRCVRADRYEQPD
jgi:hypothetical protein